MRRWAWPVAAVLAFVLLVALAFHGERPEAGLARFEPAGVLAQWPLAQVTSLDVSAGPSRRSFRRAADGSWQAASPDGPLAADLAERIESGLTLLRNSAPQRTDLESENLAEFGLAPPHLTVTAELTGGAFVTIEFGSLNPLGLERYARVAGQPGIMLLPSFVAEHWEFITTSR